MAGVGPAKTIPEELNDCMAQHFGWDGLGPVWSKAREGLVFDPQRARPWESRVRAKVMTGEAY